MLKQRMELEQLTAEIETQRLDDEESLNNQRGSPIRMIYCEAEEPIGMHAPNPTPCILSLSPNHSEVCSSCEVHSTQREACATDNEHCSPHTVDEAEDALRAPGMGVPEEGGMVVR